MKTKYKAEDALLGTDIAVGVEVLGCSTKYGSWQYTREKIDPREFSDFAEASEQARNYDPDDTDMPPLTVYQIEILKTFAAKYPYIKEAFWEYEDAIAFATGNG